MEVKALKKKIVLINGVFSLILSSVFLAPSYGDPQRKSVKEYVGSETCESCHPAHYQGWQTTLHNKMEQDVIKEGPDKNVLGDFSSKDTNLTFSLDAVDLVVGSRFKQRYLTKIGDDYYTLPAQWNVATKEWVAYQPKKDWWAAEGIYPKEWNRRPTSKLCEGCHTTGFDIQTKTPAERNITCESCHGPGSLHIEDEEGGHIINPVKLSHERGNMICFQCHMSGRPPQGEFEN